MKRRVVFYVQLIIFALSYPFFRLIRKNHKCGTVVGVEEIATMLKLLGDNVSLSKTVNLSKHPFYNFKYHYDLSKNRITSYLFSPILFSYLINKYKTFIYISGNGFLLSDIDGRELEFKILKKNNCNIICFFTGSDIRSYNLMNKFASKNRIDVITTYQKYHNIGIDNKNREEVRKKLAEIADRYADEIFNPNIDQMSYITRQTHPFLYFVNSVSYFPEKFTEDKKVIIHAPSAPLIKGTPLVRSAIKRLTEEGYDFEYIELIDVTHEVVLEHLKKAHIVLNQFYAFVPGVFGIEALSNNTVLLTSADEKIEKSLFDGANNAWVVTPYWDLYFNLKEQLEKPMAELKEQADRGTAWVEKYCLTSYSANYINKVIRNLDD